MYTLSATLRTTKRAKDELAKLRIPAVLYGQGVVPQSLSLAKTEFSRVFAAAGSSSLIDVQIEGGQTVKAVIKAVQGHVLSLEPVHVDLHQVRMDQMMTAEIPLNFIGEAPAVKVHGGTLIKSMDAVTVRCLPANLPHEINVDLSTLATPEDAITVGSLVLPAGVEIENEASATIATVAAALTEDQLKKLEESSVGDVTAVKSEAEEKRAAKEAAEAAKEADKK
ncbi:50S ribosomal protein L25 [Patescibacteria group bacterium]|jgi:large subunit ribosomal protein L25|nr:50S ribosomal protein L25 [Patescibacteria group bacterium]MDQ5919507.1 large subunit ribosomal protein [Patescibacteria group bacterium]